MANHISSQWIKLALTGLVGVFMSSHALAAPEIRVAGNNVLIPDGDLSPSILDGTDYGALKIGGAPCEAGVRDLQRWPGCAQHHGSQCHRSRIRDHRFTAVRSGSGGVASLEVQFTPTVAGTSTGSISIANNDSDENPYNFVIQALVKSPDVRVTGAGFTITPGRYHSEHPRTAPISEPRPSANR